MFNKKIQAHCIYCTEDKRVRNLLINPYFIEFTLECGHRINYDITTNEAKNRDKEEKKKK